MRKGKSKKSHREQRNQVFNQDLLSGDEEPQKKTGRFDTSKRAKLQVPNIESEEDSSPERSWGEEDFEDEAAISSLPVLTKKGAWKSQKLAQAAKKAEEEDQKAKEEDEKYAKAKSFDETRKELGLLAIAITEDTETNIGKLKGILEHTKSSSHPPEVVRLALITMLAIFRDILPGYYIRPLTDAEKNSKISKDIKKLRNFEESILLYYRKFIETLKEIVQPKYQNYSKGKLLVIDAALTCIHELMQFSSTFNLFEDILKLAAHALTIPYESKVEKTCQAFKRMLEVDEEGKVTFLTLRLLSNMIKELEYDIPPVWLSSFESIRLKSGTAPRKHSSTDSNINQKNKKYMSDREKKEWKVKQEELKKLAEAEAVTSQEQVNQWNAESLKHFFRIYFGILKSSPTPLLLKPVLAGLAKHSHRIGVEYFTDLLQALRKLMDQSNEADIELVAALHCILTVDKIYSINENLAAMDLKFFYNSLFKQLGRLLSESNNSKSNKAIGLDWDSIQEPLQACLSNLFHPKRILPAMRVAAFVQRLTDLAIVFLSNGASHLAGPAVFLIDNAKTLLTHHVRARDVLDMEPFGQGIYLPTCDDPDLCNPFARPLLPLLSKLKSLEQQRNGKIKVIVDQIFKLAPQQ